VTAFTESVLATQDRLGSRADAWEAVISAVAEAVGVAPARRAPDLPELEPWRDPTSLEHLADTHEGLVEGRQESGTFYTPLSLVGWILDRVLVPGEQAMVLDPACGAGHFLVAAARRLIAQGTAPARAVALVHGVDLDPVGVAITRLRLRALAPDSATEPDVRLADGLGEHPSAPYDVVVGNPPFLGQLRRRTAASATARAARPTGLGPYADTSAVFLRRSLDLVGPGGRVALVQPLSLLGARDSAAIRHTVGERGAVTAFWASLRPVFSGTSVLTCVPVVTVGASAGPVATWHGPAFASAGRQQAPEGEWGPLAASAAGIPAVAPRTSGTLSDLGTCTADFRDQYYGLIPFVSDGPDGVPLITSGLIDPAESRWGSATTRFAKMTHEAPRVDLPALHAEGSLSAWATARLVPKVLIATQGQVIEAVVDEAGRWLPSVPVLTFTPQTGRLWHVLAVLLAPPVVALAAARYLGTALAPQAIKLSARQVAALPLPADTAGWDRGAELACAAQHAEAAERPAALRAVAEVMCSAYDDTAALEWWTGRLRAR
jgi:SAM-dependent methyltransferase